MAAAWSQLSDRTAIFGKDALTEDVWLEDPAVFARRHNDQLADLLRGFAEVVAQYRDDRGRKVWEDFTELTSGWPAEAQQGRRNLLARYVGFPLWDTAIFPVVALTDLPQLSPIGVARFSPYDARLLPAPGGRKLWGTAYQHFGAFFELNWRQNDYLWGRLDGVELIVRMLVEAGAGPLEHSEVDQWIRAQAPQGFEAVLKSEPRLDAIEKLRADLTAAVRQLTQIHR